MHDLGYHHAVRGKPVDRRFANDQDYKLGYAAAKKTQQPSSAPELGGHGQHSLWEVPAHIENWEVEQSSIDSAEKVKSAMLKKGRRLGPMLGAGMGGAVFQSDKAGIVVKVDKGDNEARLAKFVMNDPELGKLRAFPKFFSAEPTNIFDKISGKEMHAIEREDLHDIPEDIFKKAEPHFDKLRKALDDMSALMIDGDVTRDDYVDTVDEYLVDSGVYDAAAAVHPKFAEALGDMKKLINRGIMPCDLHIGNWGERPSTGEFVMRDVGCFAVLQ